MGFSKRWFATRKILGLTALVALLGVLFVGVGRQAEAANPLSEYTDLQRALAGYEFTLVQVLSLAADSEILLMQALDLKEEADEARISKKNLESMEPTDAVGEVAKFDCSEDDGKKKKKKKKMKPAEEEEAAAAKKARDEYCADEKAKNELVQARAAEVKELNQEQQGYLFKGFMNTVWVVAHFVTLVPQTVQIGASMTTFVLSLANPMDAIGFAAAGYKPNVVKEQLDTRFNNIKVVSKAFDEKAKRNEALFKDIMKRLDLKEPKVEAAPALKEESSEI